MKAVMLHPLNYEERPRGHEPDHFEHLQETLTKRGHVMLPAEQISESDVLLLDTNIWNMPDGGTSPYNWDTLEYVRQNRLPVVWFDSFDHAGTDKCEGRWPGSDDWKDMLAYDNMKNDLFYFGWLISRPPNPNPLLYFMRKMQIHQKYPPYVHPLEYPIFEDYPLATKEELCSRPFDVCGLFNLSHTRAVAMIGLYRDGRLKCDCEVIPDYRRLDHDTWIERHRQAKFFLEADASLGSERPMRLITVAAMLRVKSDHLLPFPREDLKHQVEIGDYDGGISKADVDKVLSVVNSPDLLYEIYVNGANHMRTHYSMEARSNYIADLLEGFVK